MAANLLNDGTQYTIRGKTVFDEGGNEINLGIIYQKQLFTLMTERIAKINATLENSKTIMYSGVAIYNVARRNLTRNYTAGTTAPDTVSKRQITIPLNFRKEITYSYETLDLLQLEGPKYKDGGSVSGAFLNGLITAAAQSKEAYYYAKLLQGIVAQAIANTPIAITLNANPTLDNYRDLWKKISNPINIKVSEVSVEYIGLDREDGVLLVSPRAWNDVILATTNLGSDLSTESIRSGDIAKIGGVNVMMSPFLGSSYAPGDIDKEEAFDFQGVDMVWVHKQAIAFPIGANKAGVFIDSVGNITMYDKFGVSDKGAIAIRPTGIIGFKLTETPLKK